jgi:AcrR family transcriptional regulator
VTISKRDQILNTALKLFIDHGIHETTTASIAKASKVATGTLFHHFGNKEELVHALYHMIYDSLLNYKSKKTDHATACSVYDQLKRNWRFDIEWGTAHVEYFRFLERYSFQHYASESAINEIYGRFEHHFDLFRKAVAAHEMRTDDLEYIREHFIWNIRMNIAFFIDAPHQCTPVDIERSFDIYWRGISQSS